MEFELMEFLSPDKKDKKEEKEVEGLCSSFAAHWCSLSYIYVHVWLVCHGVWVPLNGDEESELTDFRSCQGTRGEEGLVGRWTFFRPVVST